MALEKAKLQNCDTKEFLHCLYNPTEFTIQKSNPYGDRHVVGKNTPKKPFTGGGSRQLSVELFFDVYEEDGKDVREHTDKLWQFVMINQDKKNPKTQKSDPPLCIFSWGQGDQGFKAAMTNLTVRYTLFREDGTPVRATASVSLQEAEDETDQPGTNPSSQGEPGLKRRMVRPDDTLPTIAFEEYGDPNRWRRIADANDLTDPTALRAGDILTIPRL